MYELNEFDSTFTLINEKIYNDFPGFKYFVDTNQTKLFFFKVLYPYKGNYSTLNTMIELKVMDSTGELSSGFTNSDRDYWFEKFYEMD